MDDSPIGEPKTRLDRKRIVIDGPLAETKELICGFWLWQVKSKEKAIEWSSAAPTHHNEYREIEIRQVFDPEDFGAEFTPSCESNKSACAHRSLRRNNHRSRKDKGAPIVF